MPDAIAEAQDSKLGAFGIGIENGTFESVSIRECIRGHSRTEMKKSDNDDDQKDEEGEEKFPLLLFSPGLGETRYLYSNLLSSIASQGFVIVSIDHPYDADAVEFPNGEVIHGINITQDTSTILLDLKTRVEDVSFVLGEISSSSASPLQLQSPSSFAPPSASKYKRNNKRNPILPPGVQQRTNLTHSVIFGHSFGGATAAQTLYVDSRFIGGINLDGILFGSVIGSGFGKPFFQMKSQTSSSERDSTWKKFFGNLSGWKLQVLVQGSEHESFSDLGEVIDALGGKSETAKAIVGSIDGKRMSEIVTDYVSAAVRQFVFGSQEALLEGTSKRFPEVKFLD